MHIWWQMTSDDRWHLMTDDIWWHLPQKSGIYPASKFLLLWTTFTKVSNGVYMCDKFTAVNAFTGKCVSFKHGIRVACPTCTPLNLKPGTLRICMGKCYWTARLAIQQLVSLPNPLCISKIETATKFYIPNATDLKLASCTYFCLHIPFLVFTKCQTLNVRVDRSCDS